MDFGVIITAVAGALTTIVSGWASWFFTRKKYHTEVDNAVIENMKESLEFYRKLSDDNKSRLDILIERNNILEDEIRDLRGQVLRLMATICTDLSCQVRKRDLSFVGEENSVKNRRAKARTKAENKTEDSQ